jgi:hypothetical protein
MALFALVFATLAGCRTQPIMDVDRAPVPSPTATMEGVQKAILEAGTGLGWAMKVKTPGVILGTLALRSHVAEVEITYSRSSYSIVYKSSSNLDYSAANKTIHSNYNGWIKNLDAAIRARLAML